MPDRRASSGTADVGTGAPPRKVAALPEPVLSTLEFSSSDFFMSSPRQNVPPKRARHAGAMRDNGRDRARSALTTESSQAKSTPKAVNQTRQIRHAWAQTRRYPWQPESVVNSHATKARCQRDCSRAELDSVLESATFDVSCLPPHMDKSRQESLAVPGITRSAMGECSATCARDTVDSKTNSGVSATCAELTRVP